ncbi:MAG: hydroxymethylbilane synthase [Anaerolineae bacterium]
MTRIRIGTRASDLALWQAHHVADLLRHHHPDADVELVTFTTKGDTILDQSLPSIGGKGLFTEELERALLDGRIDCAVHSLKDLPTQNPDGLIVGAVPERAPLGDVLISKHRLPLHDLPQGATVGTSSLRRAAQIRRVRPDVTIIDIRGNVPTRIDKALADDSPYDAIVLAQAGVTRLELTAHISEVLALDVMLPAPGQGAIGIQTRTDNIALFAPLIHLPTLLTVTAERAFLRRLEGGCSVPVASMGTYRKTHLHLIGRVASVDGQQWIEVQREMTLTENALADASTLGRSTADDAIAQGAEAILAEVKAG